MIIQKFKQKKFLINIFHKNNIMDMMDSLNRNTLTLNISQKNQ